MTVTRKNLIGGDPVENINPSNHNGVVGLYARATEEHTGRAIAATKDALVSWSRWGMLRRHAVLRATAGEIFARKQKLGEILSEGIAEVTRAGQIFDFFTGKALRLAGETLPSIRLGVGVETTREPVGVVGIITPWNFPMAILASKLAPAICYGNTVVIKPADRVPRCTWKLVDILKRAGLPRRRRAW